MLNAEKAAGVEKVEAEKAAGVQVETLYPTP